MELGNGWNLSEPILRKLCLLEYLADWKHASLVPPLPPWAGPGTAGHQDGVGDLEDFQARGWLQYGLDFGGNASIQFSGSGRAFVEDVRAKRDNRSVRHRATRDALLHWLYDQYLTSTTTPNLADFSRSPFGHFYGRPFAEDEVNSASRWLQEKGYLRGQGALGGGIIRPTISAEGVTLAESDRSVNDSQPIPPTSVITVTGNNNTLQTSSPGATQHVTVTITDDHRQQAIQLAELLEQSLPALSDLIPEDVTDLPDQIRSAVQTEDDNGLRRAVNAANVAMAGTVGTALGSVVAQQMHAFMQLIGLA